MMRKILNFCRRKKIPLLLCLGITMVILVVLETNLTNIIIDTRTIMRTKHQQKVEMVDEHSLKQTLQALKLVLPDLNQHHDKQPTNHNPASNHHDNKSTNHNPASKVITLKESNQRGISRVSERCLPTVDPSGIKTTFKFYIYELPPYFNLDIQNKMTKDLSYCYNLDFCGTGEELYQLSKKHSNQGKKLLDILKGRELQESTGNFDQHHHKISIRNSHQFALEVIMHYKLLHSQYRTLDPNKADFFYIPAYTGLQCLSASASELGNTELIVNLFNFLATNRSTYYKSGKPHFSTLSKIHREQASRTCTTLRHPDSENITYIAIEKESNPDWLKMPQIQGKSIIVAPYPSYVHFTNTRYDKPLLENNDHAGTRDLLKTNFRLNMPNLKRRNVFLFLAAGTRRSNPFRAKILDQFLNKTDKSHDDYFSNIGNKTAHFAQATDMSKKYPNLQQLMLITIECSSNHRNATIPWMARSIFCLQPPGDSPTRKSFYDSILSGCIPVIFTERFKTQYPFERWLNYSDFTVTIDAKLVSRYDKRIIDVLREISMEKMRLLHKNVLKVAKWFQYSIPDGGVQVDDDAVTLILKDLKAMHNM